MVEENYPAVTPELVDDKWADLQPVELPTASWLKNVNYLLVDLLRNEVVKLEYELNHVYFSHLEEKITKFNQEFNVDCLIPPKSEFGSSNIQTYKPFKLSIDSSTSLNFPEISVYNFHSEISLLCHVLQVVGYVANVPGKLAYTSVDYFDTERAEGEIFTTIELLNLNLSPSNLNTDELFNQLVIESKNFIDDKISTCFVSDVDLDHDIRKQYDDIFHIPKQGLQHILYEKLEMDFAALTQPYR